MTSEYLTSQELAEIIVAVLKFTLAPFYLGAAAAVAVWVFRGCLGVLGVHP